MGNFFMVEQQIENEQIKRILIVDDESLLCQGLGKALRSSGTQVKTVGNGNLALQEISSSNYHLCFLDLFLPDLNGTDVLVRMKEISPQTKVVMMTAGIPTVNAQDTIEKNADMFLTKPFELLEVKLLSQSILAEVGFSKGAALNLPRIFAHGSRD